MASMDVVEVDGAGGSASSAQAKPPRASPVPDRVPNHSGLHLPAISWLRSRPISRLYSRPFSRLCSRPISRPVPDPCHDSAPSRNRGLPSHSHPAVSKREPFPIPSLLKTQKNFSLRRAKRLPSRAAQWLRFDAYRWNIMRMARTLIVRRYHLGSRDNEKTTFVCSAQKKVSTARPTATRQEHGRGRPRHSLYSPGR